MPLLSGIFGFTTGRMKGLLPAAIFYMSKRYRARTPRLMYALIVLVVLGLSVFGWSVGRSVIAFRAEKTVHIFPTSVQGEGWQGTDALLEQNLASDAALPSFSPENSAFVYLDAQKLPPEPKLETPVETESEIAPVLEGEEGASEERSEEDPVPTTEAPPETVPEAMVVPATNPFLEPAAEDSVPESASSSDATATTTSSTMPSIFSLFTPIAFAQESVLTSSNTECAILAVPCHTLEFSGFTIGETLSDKDFESVAVRFSFASPRLSQTLTDDMLIVRYYHDGAWRVAGEIFLNSDVSNQTNGDYFTAKLDDVEAWEEIAGLRILVEFSDATIETPAALYLDALWIDATYKEPVQDAFLGETATEEEMPENVTQELSTQGASSPSSLTLPSGEVLTFPFADDLDEELQMRADSIAYYPLVDASGRPRSTAYISITNTGAEADFFHLAAAFPEGRGAVESLAQFKHNVPVATTTSVAQPVSYFCESVWVAYGDDYRCDEGGDVRSCVAVSEGGENCEVETLVEEETLEYVSDWVPVEYGMLESPDEFDTPGFIATQVTDPIEILPGQSVYFRIELSTEGAGIAQFALAAEGNRYSGYLDATRLSDGPVREDEVVNEALSPRHTFDADELPYFTFRFHTQRSFVTRIFNALIGSPNTFEIERAALEGDDGYLEDVTASIEYDENGEWTIRMKRVPNAYRPGKYTLSVAIREGNEVYTDTLEFYWGVLAINSHKAVYSPGEEVKLSMAALTDTGSTICDARLDLVISDPSGGAALVPVRQSGECGPDNVVDVGDYLAEYMALGEGIYSMALTHVGPGGRVLHQITDSFEVRDIVPFSIERSSATRIYPIANYTMTLSVTATEDFKGQFVEAMPEDFVIIDAGGGESDIFGNAKRLVWDVDLLAGETQTFTYTYDAPDKSPFLYLLGPAEIRQGEGIPFAETRQWKLASDAVGNLLLYWDRSYIPTGWTCVSCAGGDAFFQRFIVGSSTPAVNGGAATHTHTATGAVGGASGTNAVNNAGGGSDIASSAHTHTYSPIISSPSNLPPYRNLVIIQANSTGEVQIPAGAIAIFDVASSSLPAGWFRYAAHDGRFIRGEATANIGATAGANTHTHTITGTTGNAVGGLNASGAGTNYSTPTHNHTISSSTGAVTNVPPYREALLARITATSTAPDGMIGMWTGDTFDGWDIVSGSGGAFENRFVLASTTYGGTGGSETHTHADVTGIIQGAGSGGNVSRQNTGASTGALSTHTHSVSATSFSTADHLPPYRTAVFAKRAGGVSPSITVVYTPFESTKTGTSTPEIEFTASDPDGTDAIIYQLQWDDDADLDVSPIGDRTSNVETGCSPNCFENLTTPADTSPFTEGERIRFRIQTPLVSGTTYYWRVRAQGNGSSSWGAWATTTSFTYVGGTDPAQWFQTEDAQFETGTLIDTETFGSDSVQIFAPTPVEALVAYGEGVIQTPRYQIWDGDSWGGELSAQSVGGTIQWVITKAAPTRDEYILGTQDSGADVNVQVYDGVADTWGDLLEVTAVLDDVTARGFDIAYESQSGDAIVVYCDGDGDPSYRVWNGSNWVGPNTVTLTLANDCEYIKLASDPISDEIILVARDTTVSATDYEAIVWDGSAWGNSVTMGNMTDTLNEGIAVEYEESGNQALVATSNGDTPNSFIWAAWDGLEWSVPTAHTLGDDFEWGIMKRDVGTDNVALCYADQDDDLGVVRWDGSAWATTQEFEANGNTAADNTVDGRPISCEFEITSGRDGYLMIPYSDTTAVRYQFMDDATGFNGEASLATIASSWTVGSTRTGEGKILMVAFDDGNTQYDFSYWNGSVWDTDSTLDGSTSVTAEPFREPIHLAAQIYQPAEGTITSDPVSFSSVPGRPTWGEASWETTEPSGTDVVMQVRYGASCAALVPDVDLPSNSTGFQASASPLDLSSLSTTTYSQLCLEATLSSASQNNPTLDEWGISWERQPYLTQTNFRWYANVASLTPTDAWPSGGTDLNENDAISASYAPISGAQLRLRMNILTENVSLSAGALQLKLQYGVGATCSAVSTWSDVGAIGSTTAAWRGYDTGTITDGSTLPSTLLTSSDVAATYEEQNDSAVNPNTATAGQETEWDWVLQHNATAGTAYCFRVVTSDGVVLNEYDRYPAVVTNQKSNAPVGESPFDNEQIASTTPFFEFAAEDPESNDLTYQIQIDNDYDFSSTAFDRDSQTNNTEFNNLITPTDRDPFNSGQLVQFIPPSSLSAGTYYWRVRARDRTASNTWSDWSTVYSVTINTGTTITTWFQTTEEQFDSDAHEDTEPNVADDVRLSAGFTSGTTTSSSIDFDWKSTGNAWGELSWNDTETSSDIKYHIEYRNGADWERIPDSDLSGNAAGFDTSPVSLLGVDTLLYNEIRLVANLTDAGASPRLLDWTVEWGFAVSQPLQTALFDNEKTGTTTPSFRFESDDPESQDLVYEISWAPLPDFVSSTTRQSSAHSGFSNTASSTDTSPFVSGDVILFKIQQADALTNGNTYWWRVRARDPSGANVWSVWSPTRSFTVDTAIDVSTWFQTTDEQFETSDLNDIETTGSDSVQITSIIREAFVAYAEGTAQVPRYRIWNGTSWSAEGSALTIGDSIRFVEAAAAPTRDEYVVATMGSTGVVDTQVFDGAADTWGDQHEVENAVADVTQRGFDIAYETDSGDAIAVACNGTEASYSVWNGTSWVGPNAITLGVSGNCEWVRMASDPASDEIIAVFRDATTGAIDYEAMVWNGSAWGNATTTGGAQVAPNNEGIALEYEESGNQAVVAISNGAGNNFRWISWNGSAWTFGGTVAVVNDFANGRMCRDVGTDNMGLVYIDIDNDIGYTLWDGSNWTATTEYDTGGNGQAGRPLTCEYETNGSRDGYLLIPYSDTGASRWRYWDGSFFFGEATLSTVGDSWELRSTRTGDGTILVAAYNDADTQYDFSYWNGSTWSILEILETNSIPTVTPASIPIDIVARIYPSFTTGSVVSDEIDFDDGTGLKWDEALWSATTPGDSEIRVQVQYASSTGLWEAIPDSVIPDNSTGTTTSPIDLGSMSFLTYNELRLVADFECIDGDCPTMQDWTVTWSPGLEVSGTAKQYDQSTNVTSGTVAVAVNGTLQVGKTASISGGTWTINNVTVFPGDIVTVFVQGANDANEAVAVTAYDGIGDISGMELIERHLTLGSTDNPTLTNANLGQFDTTVGGDDVFHDVDAGNDLTVCALTGCFDSELYVKSGTTYRPDSTSSGNISTHDIELNGTLVGDGNTITVTGSWDNNATFTPNTSTVVFAATSSTESIDSTGASLGAFNNITFGTSGTGTWTLATALDVNGNLTLNFGTLSKGSQSLTIAGNLAIGASGVWAKGTATTTFDGSSTGTWSDATASKQDIGKVAIDGTAKTVQFGSNVKATDITIGSDDTLSASGSHHGIEVLGNWTNNNAFSAQQGTVTFAATTTGKTIVPGSSAFYNLTFNGAGGNWAFTTPVTASNNLTVSAGIVTLPTATTTVGGNFAVASSGSFMHNNGVVLFSAATSKTIQPATSTFYDVTFNGTGSWTFPDGFATSSRHTLIQAGTVTLPSNNFAVGGSFQKTGGSFIHNSGTIRFTASNAQTLRLNNSDAYNLSFIGSGSWSFIDTNATTTNTVLISSGTLTLPSGVFAVGGSWNASGGTFTHNSGTVKFNSSDTGETINPNGSWFSTLFFDNPTGGWTISESATSSATTTLSRATSFTLASGRTLAVGGAFANAIGSASTWTGSSLYLYSGTAYTASAKTAQAETYGALILGANTDVKMWNSDAASTVVHSSASLYSQDHGNVDGSLYIWGEYVTTSENWSYATDFDGIALGGSPRQANVRLAPSATVQFSSGTLAIVGSAGATTTIANQGSGDYGLAMSGGTLNASYYQFRNLNSSGFSLTGTPTISSLADGDFELGANGGSLLTLASSVIDANPALQIFDVRFATSSGISSGFNVTAGGSPSSYWWFRDSYGNYSGEAYDSDPGGNPGNIRWDDSGFSITVAGTVYSDRGVTEMGSPVCDDATPVVRVVVNGGSPETGFCDSSDGSYTIPGVEFTGDATIAVYLDGATEKAVTVTRTPTADVLDLDLYARTLIVRHESVAPLTIANLAYFDSSDDADVFFSASTSTADLIVSPDHELFVWGGDTFAPAGDVTLESGGSGDSRDGRLHLAANSVFTAANGQAHAIGGDFILSSGASYSAASSSLTFTATTSKSITLTPSLTLWDVAFNGAGGSWNLSGATTTVQGSFAVTQGTLAGTGNIVVESGSMTGNGTIAMTSGTVRLTGTGTIGGNSAWQFYNLVLGDATNVRATSKTGTGTTTALGVVTVRSNHTFNASSSPFVLAGSSTPFVVSGTFNVQTAPFYYTSTNATNIADEDYAQLTLTPSAAGTPTYTFMGGVFSIGDLSIGGAQSVIVTANTNDPSITLTGDVSVTSGSTLIASNVGALEVGGSWTMGGTFAHSNGEVVFDSTDAGETITAGNSPFYDVEFDSASGGWTLSTATTTRHFALTNVGSFTLGSGQSLSVGGTFTNADGGGATNWTGSTLSLRSGTSYSANTKTAGGDDYGTLVVDSTTDVRMWHSSASTTSVADTSSLYSQDHANVDGDLYIWGEYVRSTGSDYWSYDTDFDGTSLSGIERQVDVRIASSSSIALSGGVLDILGVASASTTIGVQGSGAYAFAVSGGTLNAQYYQFRNLNAAGLALSGSPTITSLADGDLELAVSNGSLITIAGSVITANPIKIVQRVRFATSTGATSGTNVTATGVTASSWKFNFHYGDIDGESFDVDPAGDPGYVLWDDSAAQITIAGTVYSDEGTTPAALCDGSTPQVRLRVQGVSAGFVSCDDTTGEYSIPNVSYNPGDSLIVYLDGTASRAANITVDPITTIANMHLYENRVIIRHEDAAPITIADMAVYDSSDDSDIPFTAVDDVADTLSLPAETKLIVWTAKTFAPAGNITLNSGGSGNAWDGTLELQASAQFSAASTQTHSIGGSLLLHSSATLSSAQSTFVMTATTTGKTIQPASSSFYNLTFNGTGGNWAFAGPATTTNNFTITLGTVTLPSGTLAIGGSFDNTGGTFMHNNGAVQFTATATGKTVRAGGSNFYDLTFSGSGGAWAFQDTSATSSREVLLSAGAATLPSGIFSVGSSFIATSTGTFVHNSGTVRMTASSAGKTIRGGSSNFNHVTFNGVGGEWTWDDTSEVANDITITNGSTTLPLALAVSGSFQNTGGSFYHNGGTITFNAGATGKNIRTNGSWFHTLVFSGASGGWTVLDNATSTGALSITAANSFTQSSGTTLAVGGAFTNAVGGAATTWTGSTLRLVGATSTVNTKAQSGDSYNTVIIGPSTHVSWWNSSAVTTSVDATGSLHSKDHAGVDGDLNIWGAYERTTGSEYWNYSNDFDGASLGVPRRANVRIASSSSVTLSGGTLDLVGNSASTTRVSVQGSGAYAFDVTGGTFNASHYEFRNTDADGLNLTGSPSITSLSNGNFELAISGGAMITLAGSVIDANASKVIDTVAFATSSGVSSGFNILRTGSPVSAWNFDAHTGNYDGEAYDSDGGDACGSVRWDDSACLFVSEEHYRWRNDDGGEGAPTSEWFDVDWSKRKKITIANPTASTLTNFEVELEILYDADMQADFDDLRFTNETGTTSIDYWIESYDASASSTVWIEVPSLPASGQAVVYVYYGNASVLTTGDGTAVFEYFDDFEDGNITEYSGNTSLFTAGTAFNYTYARGLDTAGSEELKTTTGLYRTGSHTAQGDRIRYFQYVDATQEDEACTLFGVQASGQNYAVCLDRYPSDKVIIAENVISNEEEGSGDWLASTTVTYSTSGWYEVMIDWIGSSITANVYDPNGSLFANVATTDSSYSGGGVGFSFWSQHGGWDYYSARAYTASDPVYAISLEQSSGGATWRAAENTLTSGVDVDENVRLRFSIQNSGSAIEKNLRLQVASKGSALSCEAVSHGSFSDVPLSDDCGSSPACMAPTANFTDLAPTTELLSSPASMTFVAGSLVEDLSNESSLLDVPGSAFTEVEYNFQMTTSAVASAYCFRASDAGASLDNYDRVAELQMVHAPFVTNWAFSTSTITLTEGATTTVSATGTVTDFNGYADIVVATSTFYRSDVGDTCNENENSCYPESISSCALSNCAGNSCTLTCRADLQYHADPTDAGSTYEASNWLAHVFVADNAGLNDSVTSLGVELLSLFGLDVTAAIDYGILALGESSTTTAQTTVANTGNIDIDLELEGTNLGSITPENQAFATSTFVYASCSICQFLTGVGTPTSLEVDLPKPTSTSTPITDDVYWGINVPTNSSAGNFQGTNTFWATAE